jgi:hypothetical protein
MSAFSWSPSRIEELELENREALARNALLMDEGDLDAWEQNTIVFEGSFAGTHTGPLQLGLLPTAGTA